MNAPAQSLQKGKTPAVGKAYAFFRAECGVARIRHELNELKADPDTRIPNNLQVFTYTIGDVRRNKMVANNEKVLVVLSAAWLKGGANYFMKTFLPYATNREVAATTRKIFEFMALDSQMVSLDKPNVIEVYFRDERGKLVANSQITVPVQAVEPANSGPGR
jgi:hypothetical protein